MLQSLKDYCCEEYKIDRLKKWDKESGFIFQSKNKYGDVSLLLLWNTFDTN
jgi:hypothetical protein